MNTRHDDRFAAEYQAMETGCGCYALSDWTVVTLTGADRQTFLHNICTNDIRKLAPGEGCEAFCTDVKGKIVAHVYALLREDRILLLTVPGQAEQIVNHLDRYIIREDVQLANVSQWEAWFVLAGKQADTVLPGSLVRAWQNVTYKLGGVECVAARFPLPGKSAYLVGVARERVAALLRHLESLEAIGCGESVWTSLRVEAGLPLFGVDFDHSNLPQEVSRDAQAISFTKGCYLGQETIARLDALGHVNKQLVTLKFNATATPQSGAPLTHNGQPAGTATSIGWSERLGLPLGLGMVRRGSNAEGTRLDSPSGPVEVIATPAMS